ncbi:lutropin subunit beta [Latimeria chalumnae]|uniref:Luteinizing hormone subunit beta n=1 Tax=Latimeria chalumnae TaxID=7897 RepID=H3BES9_LATCH|nr:PREDICTED: lutropin subunit beta [Latimeria chalumnae]|eukprot:XP_014341039.1 PREDICTED: lutropin subunit beta [Latimeria chalumnae]
MTLIQCFVSLLLLSAVQGRNRCLLTNATISAEKDGCPVCVTLTTSICTGYCHTMEPSYKSPLSNYKQNLCTYKEIEYATTTLPDCSPNVDPTFTYPVAVRCECSQCNTDNSDCTVQSIGPDFCSTRRVPL